MTYVMLKSISNKTITFKMVSIDDIPSYYIKCDYMHRGIEVYATKSYLATGHG